MEPLCYGTEGVPTVRLPFSTLLTFSDDAPNPTLLNRASRLVLALLDGAIFLFIIHIVYLGEYRALDAHRIKRCDPL